MEHPMGARRGGCRRRVVWLGSTAVHRRVGSLVVLSCLATVGAGPAAADPPPPPSCAQAPYDIDGNSQIEPLTDGLLLLRHFFGFRGSVLISGAVGQGCTRCTASAIEEFIAQGLAGCPVCGDHVLDAGEECDGPDLGGNDCPSFGFFGGTLGCTEGCTFDVSACNNCGDSVVDAGESCDGFNLNGQSCMTQGFSSGSLACTATCSFNTSACVQ